MRLFIASAIGTVAALLLGSCAGPGGPPVNAVPADLGPLLRPGDVIVASDEGEGGVLRRYRTRVDAAERLRVSAVELLRSPAPASRLAVSGDGRWLAAELQRDETPEVLLWDLARPGGPGEPVWVSPPGCSGPSLHPQGELLVLGCPRSGRRPASVVEVRLPDLSTRALAGETDRFRPVVGWEGDLYWVEEQAARSAVLRMSSDRVPYVVHTLSFGLDALWPQVDGSLLAERRAPGTERSLVHLDPAGDLRPLPLPTDSLRRPAVGDALLAGPSGTFLFATCTPEPCAVLRVGPAGAADAPLSLAEPVAALAEVPAFAAPIRYREDLCTAPASVFRTHDADHLAVLGVQLDTPLETAFSLLDRAGRHPHWILREDDRPAGIGLGSVPSGQCIRYEADEAGLVAAIELQGCAVPYLSPALQPLLTVDRRPEGALPTAREFLGPGVAGSVGNGRVEGPAAEAAERLPIEARQLRYEALDRGYRFEARTELLNTGRIRFLDGRVLLRLQRPGESLTAERR